MESFQKLPLIGMSLDELRQVAISGGMPKFVGAQLADWLYKKKVTDFDSMLNISKKNRQFLEENYLVGRTAPSASVKSSDGTVKYLFKVRGDKILRGCLFLIVKEPLYAFLLR